MQAVQMAFGKLQLSFSGHQGSNGPHSAVANLGINGNSNRSSLPTCMSLSIVPCLLFPPLLQRDPEVTRLSTEKVKLEEMISGPGQPGLDARERLHVVEIAFRTKFAELLELYDQKKRMESDMDDR